MPLANPFPKITLRGIAESLFDEDLSPACKKVDVDVERSNEEQVLEAFVHS